MMTTPARAPSPAAVVSDDMLVGERVHPLKTWPRYFAALLDGSKTFEARTNDRDYRVGDVLHLREWDSIDGYSGRELWFRATYVLTGGEVLGLPDHIAILGLRPFSASRAAVEVVCAGDKACGRPIADGEAYRCLDCGAVMHRDCLRWHCGADEKDRLVFRLQGQVAELKAHLQRLCSDQLNVPTDVMVERAAEVEWEALEQDAARWRAVRDRATVSTGSASTLAYMLIQPLDTAPRASTVILVPDDFADECRSLFPPTALTPPGETE